MNFKILRHFVVLAETLHFGRAAERLHMTQPPLSRQIAGLEAELGMTLFERHSRFVALTPAGQEFYQRTVQLLADYEQAIRYSRAAEQGERGELTLGFSMFSAWYAVPEVVAAFRKRYSKVNVRLKETLPRDLMHSLVNGSIDVGIGFAQPVVSPVCFEPLYQEPLCLALPADHSLVIETENISTSAVDVAELMNEPFIISPEQTAPELYQAVMSCCRQRDFEPKICMEADLQQTIVNLVARGLGVALVPSSMQAMKIEGVCFRSVLQSTAIEQGLFWESGHQNSCVELFLQQAREVRFDSFQVSRRQ